MSQKIASGGFLSYDKKRIINLKEIEKYKQPDFITEDYGIPSKDTPETIKEKWQRDKRYKWAKIIVTKLNQKENGKDVYKIEVKPGLLTTEQHNLRIQELGLFFTFSFSFLISLTHP